MNSDAMSAVTPVKSPRMTGVKALSGELWMTGMMEMLCGSRDGRLSGRERPHIVKNEEIDPEERLLHLKALLKEARDFLERNEIRAVVEIHVAGARNDQEFLRFCGEPVGVFGKFD